MALAQERIVDGECSPVVKRTRSRRNTPQDDLENIPSSTNTNNSIDDATAILPKKRGRKSNKQRLEQQQQQAAMAAEEMMSGLPELSTAAAASGAFGVVNGSGDGFVGFGDFFYTPHEPQLDGHADKTE